MVAKITVGHSLYGALAYNGEKVNEEKGRLIAVHKIFDDGTGKLDIRRANDDFMRLLPEQMRTKNPVVRHSSQQMLARRARTTLYLMMLLSAMARRSPIPTALLQR